MTRGHQTFSGNKGITFSNAATGYSVFDWEDGDVTLMESKSYACTVS
jgi:hypothetical protein